MPVTTHFKEFIGSPRSVGHPLDPPTAHDIHSVIIVSVRIEGAL